MVKELVTTGQAAKLCAVTPDTILKWIKKNRIETNGNMIDPNHTLNLAS